MNSLASLIVAASVGAGSQGVVLDFTADYCGPCQSMNPIVQRMQRQGYAIKQVDVEKYPELARKYNVTRIPTFVLLVDGQEVKRLNGVVSETSLKQFTPLMQKQPQQEQPAQQQPETLLVSNQPAGSDMARTNFESIVAANGITGLERASLGSSVSSLADPNTGASATNVTPRTPVGGSAQLSLEERIAELDPGLKPGYERAVVRGNNDTAPAAATIFESDPYIAATARIRVRGPQRSNYGSATVIHSEPGRTLLLTCGHVLRDAGANGKVEVDLFATKPYKTYVGTPVDFNLDADVGLIQIATEQALPMFRVATTEAAVSEGDGMVSMGCGSGQEPSRQEIRVTALNRYRGPDNIECTGVPIQGRSGGGLFNQAGEVVGVCILADKSGQRGIYCGLKPIQEILNKNGFGKQRQAPSEEMIFANTEESAPAANLNDFASTMTNEPAPMPNANGHALAANPTTNEVDIIRKSLANAGGAKLTIIIEPENAPHLSKVVVIPVASKKLIAELTGAPFEPQVNLKLTSERRVTNHSGLWEQTRVERPRFFSEPPQVITTKLDRPTAPVHPGMFRMGQVERYQRN